LLVFFIFYLFIFFMLYFNLGAIWTGDNAAEWSHLEISVPMVLQVSLCGIAHSGGIAACITCHAFVQFVLFLDTSLLLVRQLSISLYPACLLPFV